MQQNESEYLPSAGVGGAINLVATSHPEPKRDDPLADRLTRAELLKQRGWSEADLAVASSVSFPRATYQTMARGRTEFFWSRREVDGWLERVKSLKIR
jgi:hypothetical protein